MSLVRMAMMGALYGFTALAFFLMVWGVTEGIFRPETRTWIAWLVTVGALFVMGVIVDV